MTQQLLSLSELEAHLWESANILRGPIDQADFKSYVFPLLFLKRISDVYDEEFQQALDESDGDVDYAGFAENHRFQVPESAHWNDLRERTENVGQAIQGAMRAIEQANPMLVEAANVERARRYDRWHALLLEELDLVAAPGAQTFAVGRDVGKHLAARSFRIRRSSITRAKMPSRDAEVSTSTKQTSRSSKPPSRSSTYWQEQSRCWRPQHRSSRKRRSPD